MRYTDINSTDDLDYTVSGADVKLCEDENHQWGEPSEFTYTDDTVLVRFCKRCSAVRME